MEKEERNYSEYCSCGAQHGIVDGSYNCIPNCLANYLKKHPEEEKEYLIPDRNK